MRLWLVLALAGCQSRTELMIGVATNLTTDKVDHLQLSVNRDGVSILTPDWVVGPNAPDRLPGSFGLSADTSVPIQLDLVGLKGSQTVLARHTALTLVEGETLFYRMTLTAECIHKQGCAPSEDCVEGTCHEIAIDSSRLPVFVDKLTDTLACTSAITYVDTSTGNPMNVALDAASCPGGRCLEGVCLKPVAPTAAVDSSKTLVTLDDGERTGVCTDFANLLGSARTISCGSGSTTTTLGGTPQECLALIMGLVPTCPVTVGGADECITALGALTNQQLCDPATALPSPCTVLLSDQCSAPASTCSGLQTSGADTPETRIVEMGRRSGTFDFTYDMFSLQDQMKVTYQGVTLLDTGCVSNGTTVPLTYSGTSTQITVDVTPNCAGGSGTAWQFTVGCPR